MTSGRLEGCAILVVEDEPLIACEIAMTLEEAGARVIGPAATVARALSLISQGAPSAAVLDVRLGREDVFEVAARLTTLGVPFVFHTGHADAATLAAWPSRTIVRKPAPPEAVVDALRAQLMPSMRAPRS